MPTTCIQKQRNLLNLVKTELNNSVDLLDAKTRIKNLDFILSEVEHLEQQPTAVNVAPPLPLSGLAKPNVGTEKL